RPTPAARRANALGREPAHHLADAGALLRPAVELTNELRLVLHNDESAELSVGLPPLGLLRSVAERIRTARHEPPPRLRPPPALCPLDDLGAFPLGEEAFETVPHAAVR